MSSEVARPGDEREHYEHAQDRHDSDDHDEDFPHARGTNAITTTATARGRIRMFDTRASASTMQVMTR